MASTKATRFLMPIRSRSSSSGVTLSARGGLVLLEAFRALRHLGLELHLVTKDRQPPEPGVFIYNNLEANSQPLKNLYHTCDIFALPHLRGTPFAMVLSEAGASGMAIISTSVAAIPEFVRNGENGSNGSGGRCSLPDAGTPDLATNPTLRMNLGERAMAHVTLHYDAPTNASRPPGTCSRQRHRSARCNTCRSDGTLCFIGARASMDHRTSRCEWRGHCG